MSPAARRGNPTRGSGGEAAEEEPSSDSEAARKTALGK
jgi:hypothetical protein